MTVLAMLFLAAGAAVWPDGSAVDAWFAALDPGRRNPDALTQAGVAGGNSKVELT